MLLCLQAADAERSLKAAKRMVAFMDASDMTAIAGEDSDGTAVAELYHTCARVCIEGMQRFSPVGPASMPSPGTTG